jgi:signal transduction histidine kinase
MPTADDLAALAELADVPRDELQWLLDHGEVQKADDGHVFRGGDGEVMGLFLLLSGRFSVRVDQGGVEREVREVMPGRATGHLPYSRMTTPRGYLVADGPVEFLTIRREQLPDMTRACYEFTAVCVHEMLERVRVFKADDKRQEKMAALGRLSAGLAHELNNPVSAAARAARDLEAARSDLVAAARDVGGAGLGAEALRALGSLESGALEMPAERLSPLQLSDREDGWVDWLAGRGVDTELAYPLAESGLTVDDLGAVAEACDGGQLAVLLRYLAADCAARGLTAVIASSAERIHSLVAAVKKHTHMDRAPAAEPIRLGQHLADTVMLTSAKASLKGVSVELHVEPDLPPVEGSVADLNQVWMHLVDNAIDAADGPGRITIDARLVQEHLVIGVIDDGPGIAPELQERVFDPFFTTKEVGEGRGLGLDTVRTVVHAHRGMVELTSIPGRTEFRVTLPAWGGR